MFIEAAEQVVLALLVQLDFFAKPEIHSILEVPLHQKQRFVGVCRRSERGYGSVSVLFSDRFETLVNYREQIFGKLFLSTNAGLTQARPAIHRMEAEAAFIAQPA